MLVSFDKNTTDLKQRGILSIQSEVLYILTLIWVISLLEFYPMR